LAFLKNIKYAHLMFRELSGRQASALNNCARTVRALLMVVVSLLIYVSFPAQGQVSREYQLKAAFLLNFAQFTEWPTNTFPSSNAPIVIGIIGTDPFGKILDDTVRNETVNGHPLVVQRYERLEEVDACHVLFIPRSESRQLDPIVNQTRGKPILTVSDIEGSAFRGVMIRLVTENNKIRIRINTESVAEAHLTLSSKLLRVAETFPQRSTP
jgi:hypothetical protein